MKNYKKVRLKMVLKCWYYYFCLWIHIYDGYFNVNQIIVSQKFSIKYLLLKIYYLGFFITERISGIVYILDFSGEKFVHFLRKCECSEKKY
jgi:hypothetical protein